MILIALQGTERWWADESKKKSLSLDPARPSTGRNSASRACRRKSSATWRAPDSRGHICVQVNSCSCIRGSADEKRENEMDFYRNRIFLPGSIVLLMKLKTTEHDEKSRKSIRAGDIAPLETAKVGIQYKTFYFHEYTTHTKKCFRYRWFGSRCRCYRCTSVGDCRKLASG